MHHAKSEDEAKELYKRTEINMIQNNNKKIFYTN